MVRVKVDLGETGCSKPGCKHRFSAPPSRHHRGNEKSWLNLWNRVGPPAFRGDLGKGRKVAAKLRQHYHLFRPQDTVRICEAHHVEIHQIYRGVLSRMEWELMKPRALFTMEEALRSIIQCRRACDEWMKKETPGVSKRAARRMGWRR